MLAPTTDHARRANATDIRRSALRDTGRAAERINDPVGQGRAESVRAPPTRIPQAAHHDEGSDRPL